MVDFDKNALLEKWEVQEDKGLSSFECKDRLKKYGENTLEEKKESWLKKLSAFFWGPIPWMIEAAALLSGILEKWPDFIVILLMLFINAGLGFFQEFRAGNAIEALKKKLALKARVLRDGSWQDIQAKEVVPGDIIMIKLGNIVPADTQLISGEYLSIDQSALTGESLPVQKKIGDVAYSGTVVKLGEMIGVVTETGMETFFGKTAKLVETAKTKSHLQEAILKIGNFLILFTLSTSAILLLISLYRLKIEHTSHETLGAIVIFILVLIVGGIPVALPAVLSATMAIGANKLAGFKAIVARLTAIEELAAMDILCCDKTGTLTKNQLTVGNIEVYSAADKDEVLSFAYLASNPEAKDPIDEAISANLKEKEFIKRYKKEKFIPFDPVIKRTEATLKDPAGKQIKVIKGAPQVVLDIVNPDNKREIVEKIEEFAQKGFRTLGVAKQENNHWFFLGLISLFDPPREDTKKTLSYVKKMGVKVKMVTGDHIAIAKELASQLNLGKNIVSMEELFKEDIPFWKREQIIEQSNGFAEVFPEHKFDIVRALQHKRHVVGMTGDGVNDAPALKQADVGIAVEGATDAAKQASDLVLTKPGLKVISLAIEEARRIFGRMKSYAMYRISETCRLLLFLLLSMLIFHDHPLSAIMIILIALLNDIPIMMISYDHMRVKKNPVFWNMKEILTISIGLAVVGVISTFGLYWIGDKFWFAHVADPHMKFYMLRTLAFMAILCGGNLTIYLTRNIGPIWRKPLPEWKFLSATILPLIAGTLASVYGLNTNDFVGIGWKYVVFSWIYILIWFIICMFTKEALYYLIGYRKAYLDQFVLKTSGKMLFP